MFSKKSLNFLKNKNFNNLTSLISEQAIYNDDNKNLIELQKNKEKINQGNYKILQEISYSCLGKCPYCMNKDLNYNVINLNTKDYINFYQKIIDNGGTIIELRITGGEPLQPDNIQRTKEIINYAFSQAKIEKIHINTNGNWPIPIEWSNNPKIIIQFSLDGNEEKTNKNYGSNFLYQHLIKNCDYCIKNNINFQYRCVIEDKKEIQDILILTEKYSKYAIISWACPVGGATQKIDKDIYLNHLKNTYFYEQYFLKNKLHAHMRPLVGYCNQTLLPNYINFMITPDGTIGTCAYLANIIHTPYTIYNFPFDNIFNFREYIRNIQKDITCDFPNGFLNFFNSLSKEEKNIINFYLTDFHRTSCCPSIKNFYHLTL